MQAKDLPCRIYQESAKAFGTIAVASDFGTFLDTEPAMPIVRNYAMLVIIQSSWRTLKNKEPREGLIQQAKKHPAVVQMNKLEGDAGFAPKIMLIMSTA